jgi:phage-related tail fiber protein
MADFNGTILTDKGRNLLAKALTGTELKFTKVSLGDGVWDDSVSPESLTDLVSKKMDLAINELDVTGDGTARLRFVLTNTGLTDGFFTREIGIYADDPDDGEILYAVTYSNNPDFIPSDGVVKVENVTDIYTVVSNAQNVEAVISDTVVIATKDDVDTLKTDLESGNITVSTANNANNLGGEAPQAYAKADLSTTDDSVILEKLKNVDGANSGLDADLVQGVTKDLLGIGGNGYSWVDETNNRDLNVTYTNTTGKPIMVSVACYSSSNNVYLSFYINDTIIGSNQNYLVGSEDCGVTVGLTVIIPPENTYKVELAGNGSLSIKSWFELK